MRTVLGLVVVLLTSLLLGNVGSASVKLPPPCKVLEVPAKATYIVDRGTATSQLSTEAKWTSTDLPANYRRVTVSTRPGRTYKMSGVVGLRCMFPRYQATSAVPAYERFRPAATWSGSRLDLSWNPDSEMYWTQIDWAYSKQHLDKGWHATTITTKASLELPTEGAPIALRITRHRIDGSTAIWNGWTDPGQPGLLDSAFPTTLKVKPSASPPRERTVPVNPTFMFGYSAFPQWLAIKGADTQVPTRVQVLRTSRPSSIRVPLAEGETIRFLQLPLKPDWQNEPILRATTADKRTKDPAPNVSLPPNAYSDYVRIINLQIADSSRVPWGKLELDWALTRDELGRHAEIMDNHELQLYGDGSVFADGRPTFPRDFKNIFIRVTPVWDNGERGRSFEGRIDRKGNTESVTLVPL